MLGLFFVRKERYMNQDDNNQQQRLDGMYYINSVFMIKVYYEIKKNSLFSSA